MNKITTATICFFLSTLAISQNVESFYGSTDGTESIDLTLGKNGSGTSFKFLSSDPGGSNYLRIHARRWGAGFTWSRESNGGANVNIAYLYGASSGQYFQLFHKDQSVKAQLHSNGNSFVDGGNFGVGTSSPNFHFHTVGSDRARFEQTDGTIDIVAYGSGTNAYNNTAGLFASNQNALVMTGLAGSGDIKLVTRPSGYSTRMIIKSNGRVGIGTTNPSYHFHTVGSDRARFEQTEGIIDIVAYGSGTNAYNNTAGLFASNQNALVMTGLQGTGDIKFITRPGGYLERMTIKSNGNIGVGTNAPSHKLEVNGTIRSKEVKVEANSWPDYVFETSYDLKSLEEIEQYIQSNKHLPEVPSAKEMEANGVQLGEMNMLLLKKIEELTLHLIEVNNKNEKQQKEIKAQKELNSELLQRIEKLEKR